MHMRATLTLGNHRGSPERQLPRQPTPPTQPGLYPAHGSDCPLPIHPLLRPPPPCTPFQKVVPFPRGLGDGEVPHLSSPPPCCLPGLLWKAGDKKNQRWALGKDSQCRARDTGTPRVMTPACSSQRTSQRGRAGKERERRWPRYQGSFILSCPLSISVIV